MDQRPSEWLFHVSTLDAKNNGLDVVVPDVLYLVLVEGKG